MGSGHDTYYVDGCMAIKETEKGLLVMYEGEEIWVPKSQIRPDSEVTEDGDEGVLAIPRWLADDKGFTE